MANVSARSNQTKRPLKEGQIPNGIAGTPPSLEIPYSAAKIHCSLASEIQTRVSRPTPQLPRSPTLTLQRSHEYAQFSINPHR